MFKFLNNTKMIIRQGKKICELKNEINNLNIDLAIQKSVKKQFANNLNEVIEQLNISTQKLFDIKFILLRNEQSDHIVLEKIKAVINSKTANR